jgi:signal transduction histidine kinase/CheY-like chemotaxis protein/HPt (histidine-containing phosphotransfer) domain-containing protein
VKRKIIAAFLLAVTAIVAALLLTRFSFDQMMETVDHLSEPNQKLVKLNKVFAEITMLDQQQRAEAIQNPQKPYKYFLDQSGFLHLMIDSLKMLPWDSIQQKRLNSLSSILKERNQIFVSYLKVKAELADNKEFSHQLDTLALLLKESQKPVDTSIVTTQQKKTTTVSPDTLKKTETAESGNFLKRLFNKKKKKDPAALKIQEELNIKIDTITVARDAIDYEQMQKVIRELESDQQEQRKKLYGKELELIHANSLFINQLLNTLEEVENEELENMRASNQNAADVVNKGINRMNVLVIGFIAGVTILIFFIFLDISRSNFYKLQLEKAKTQAEELTKIKQRFLANMSHEIRTPLQSIIGFTEQLKQEHSNDEAVSAIHSSSEHLLHIVNEVLDYSRISSGNFTLSVEPFNLKNIIREVESGMRIQANNKHLKFNVEYQGDADQYILGDAFRLRQVLYNLLGNAIKFTNHGNVTMSIKTMDEADKLKSVFTISDTGIGMNEEELGKIFNHFEQANSRITKTFGGTGLGLTIVKALIDVQGGAIDVQSKPDEGTTFIVTLHYKKAEMPVTNVEESVTQSSKSVHAVMVDDDPMIVKLCGLILKKANINHKAFNNPLQLLDMPVDETITHFLIDIRMPEMSGVQLCKALRQKYSKDLKFIALTAHVLPEEKDSLLKQGFDDVLPKPFHESDLLKALGQRVTMKASSITHDFAELRKMTMGDEALFNSIMQQFLEESDDDLDILKQELRKNGKVKMREIVHKLAGRFGQMGIFALSSKWHAIEVDLVAGKQLKVISENILDTIKETDSLLNNVRLNTQETIS